MLSLAIDQAPSLSDMARAVLIRSSIALSPWSSGAAPALTAPSLASSAMALPACPAPRRDQHLHCAGGCVPVDEDADPMLGSGEHRHWAVLGGC